MAWPEYLRDRDPSPRPGVVAALREFDPKLRWKFNTREDCWQVWIVGVDAPLSPAVVELEPGLRAAPILWWCGEPGTIREPGYEALDVLSRSRLNRFKGNTPQAAARNAGRQDWAERKTREARAKASGKEYVRSVLGDFAPTVRRQLQDAMPANFTPPGGP